MVPTGHLAEVTLLEVAAGETAATHEDLDGATIGGPTIEGRKPKAAADQVGRQMVGLDEPTGGVAPLRPAPKGSPCPLGPRQGPRVAGGVPARATLGRARQDDGGGRPAIGDGADAAEGIAAPGVLALVVLGARRAPEDPIAGVRPTPVAVLGPRPHAGRATADGPEPARVHTTARPGATQDTASEGAPGGVAPAAPSCAATLDHEAKANPRAAIILAQVGGAARRHETKLGRLLFLDVHYFDCEL